MSEPFGGGVTDPSLESQELMDSLKGKGRSSRDFATFTSSLGVFLFILYAVVGFLYSIVYFNIILLFITVPIMIFSVIYARSYFKLLKSTKPKKQS